MTLNNTNGKTHIVKVSGRDVNLLDPKAVAKLSSAVIMKMNDKDRAVAMETITKAAKAGEVGKKRTHLMSEGNVSFSITNRGNDYDGQFVVGGIGRFGVQLFGAQWVSLFALIGDTTKLLNQNVDKLSFIGNTKYDQDGLSYLTQFILADEGVQQAAQALQDATLKAHQAALEESKRIIADMLQQAEAKLQQAEAKVAPTVPPAGTTTQPEGPALEDAAAE